MRKALAKPKPIEVRFSGHRPVALRLAGRWRPVRNLLDYWRETGRWWTGEKEKEFLRLEAGGILLIGRARQGPDRQWRLYGLDD